MHLIVLLARLIAFWIHALKCSCVTAQDYDLSVKFLICPIHDSGDVFSNILFKLVLRTAIEKE